MNKDAITTILLSIISLNLQLGLRIHHKVSVMRQEAVLNVEKESPEVHGRKSSRSGEKMFS
jgi:hypothetical protein